jgi:hypothetical protein
MTRKKPVDFFSPTIINPQLVDSIEMRPMDERLFIYLVALGFELKASSSALLGFTNYPPGTNFKLQSS